MIALTVLFILFLLISVAWIWGICALFSEGFILEYVGNKLKSKLPDWITDPIFGCSVCMSSVHGTLIFFLSIMAQEFTILLWPIFCICLCGINFIINKLSND